MKDIPNTCRFYKKTPTFDETSVPIGLLRAHQTKAGTWGKIVVLSGKLHYRILQSENEQYELDPDHSGVVEPEVLHEVEPMGPVRFFVEFFK
ncbi:MAG: DUF1971 domain-containing protein [Pseudomonadales bacterium]|nr:DUF1971 domain-containing protein [Pseudomonadales bacterium]